MSSDTQDIPMPQVGDEDEEVDEVTLVAWLKGPGDRVVEGEVIAEAMTEKLNFEIESPVAGVLKVILVEEDAAVAVGQPIARVARSEG